MSSHYVVKMLLSLAGRRPKGTAFVKFATPAAADAAVLAANTTQGSGILMKGRTLNILKALDKKSIQKVEMEKKKNEASDPRNLYLAKVIYFLLACHMVLCAVLYGERQS